MNTTTLQSDQELTAELLDMGLVVDRIQHGDRLVVMAHNWFGGSLVATVTSGPDQWDAIVARFIEKAA